MVTSTVDDHIQHSKETEVVDVQVRYLNLNTCTPIDHTQSKCFELLVNIQSPLPHIKILLFENFYYNRVDGWMSFTLASPN